MATYEITGPDGGVYQIEGPEGATDAQLIAQVQGHISSQKPTAETPAKDAGLVGDIGRIGAGVVQGAVIDPLLGIAQLGGHLVGAGKSIDALVNAENQAYKKLRSNLGGEGTDVARGVGTIAPAFISGGASLLGRGAGVLSKAINPISSTLKAAAPEALGAVESLAAKTPIVGKALTGNIAKGAATGAEQVLVAPEFDPAKQGENYFQDKSLLGGAIFGGIANPLLKAVTPKAGSLGEKLAQEGEGTLGQQSQNPFIQKLERGVAKYVPFSGPGTITNQEKALAKIKAEQDVQYSNLYKGAKLEPSPEVDNIVADLVNTARERRNTFTSVGKEDAKDILGIAKAIRGNVKSSVPPPPPATTRVGSLGETIQIEPKLNVTPNKVLEGRDLDRVLKALNEEKDKAFKEGRHGLGYTIKDTVERLKETVAAKDPNFRERLNKLNKEYAQYKQLIDQVPGRSDDIRAALTTGQIIGNFAKENPSSLLNIPGLAAFPIPYLFRNPNFTRNVIKASSRAIPLNASDKLNDNYKRGGLAMMAEGGSTDPYASFNQEEPGLETPFFIDDLIGPGLVKGLGGLAAKGLAGMAGKGALIGLAGTVGKKPPVQNLWEIPKQQFDSAATSINDKKLPSAFTKLLNKNEFKPNTTNIDIGGGRFDNATEALAKANVKNHVFDPFNRSYEHNMNVVKQVADGKADTATINNVLNVIAERDNQLKVLQQARNALKKDGKAYISVYEGNKTGIGKPTSKGFQHNKSTKEYLDLVKEVFPNAEIKNGIITTTKRKGGLVWSKN